MSELNAPTYWAKVGKATTELESPVADLVLMVKLVADHFERLLRPSKDSPNEVSMFNHEAEVAMFAIYQIQRMAHDLEKRYFAVLENTETA